MRNEKFKEKINSDKDNKNGEQTYIILRELFDNRNLSIGFLSRFRWIKNIFFKKEKTNKEIISENMDIILNKTNSDNLLMIFTLLATEDETKDYIYNNIQEILKKKLSMQSSKVIINKMSDVFKMLGEVYGEKFANSSKKTFIENNIDTILNNVDSIELLDHVQNLIGVSNVIDTKVNRMLDDNKDILIQDMIRRIRKDNINSQNIVNVLNENKEKILEIIEKYMKLEHVRWIDIKKFPKNSKHRDIYQIGTKILRVGVIKEKKEIPFSPRIVQPIESKQLLKGSIPYGTIDIMDKADRIEPRDLENKEILEDIYQLYKELRKLNIIWVDAPHSLGFKKGTEKILQNMVILDTDSLYNSEDKENLKRIQMSEHSRRFEERWNSERQGLQDKLHSLDTAR